MAHVQRKTRGGSTSYVVRWVDHDPATGRKRERSRSFARKIDADRFRVQVEAEAQVGLRIDHDAAQTPFVVYADRWTAIRRGTGDLSPSTIDRDQSYLRSMILPTFGDRPVGSVKTSHVETWIAALDRSTGTKAKALQIVRQVFALAVRDQAIRANPAVDVKTPKDRDRREGIALDGDQIAAVLTAADQTDVRTAPVVWTMARAGLRVGEALALRRNDVDVTAGTLRVERTRLRDGTVGPLKGRTRFDQGRTIALAPDLVERLARHLRDEPASIRGDLVTAPRGGPLTYPTWRSRVWTRIVAQADVGDVKAHDLRHSFATRAIVVDRWAVPEVAAYLGHVDGGALLLRRYAHVLAASTPIPSALDGTR